MVAATQQAKRDLRLNFLIQDVAHLQLSYFDRFMQPLGITRSQWEVVMFVSRREGANQSELASMLDMSRVNLGSLLDKLEAGGFLRRKLHPNDGRAKCVYLTDKGNGIVEQIRAHQEEYNGIVLADLKGYERDMMIDLLKRMKHAMQEAPQQALNQAA
ncbi:MarR family winged helix-turn-helix transcriptional regulator [Novosphingobium sp. 9U]|uniref:MarR family winged helix-turn-helix transcriptional regulator n=1 Tax=Novosphingobium sp. 9U TaxID=2653158 RepID=UPI0012F0BF95|nr:MarR family transcriptional regulator [Novosphingobium sp. 9U]VWX50134.1 hypothetical protein NOVOSPHI9U_260182 [Novosphingobium sp. 9U]